MAKKNVSLVATGNEPQCNLLGNTLARYDEIYVQLKTEFLETTANVSTNRWWTKENSTEGR